MPCMNCGATKTVRAHLFPQCLTKEIQVGTAHATNARPGRGFFPTQSGTFDPELLCAPCDQTLGYVEEATAIMLAAIREQAVGRPEKILFSPSADSDIILRFCAAVLWKYSATKSCFGKIELGPYQELTRKIAFSEISPASSFDAVLFRLRKNLTDSSSFLYRAPVPDRKEGANLWRFSIGGMLFLVKTDKRHPRSKALDDLWIRRRPVRFLSLPLHFFEEFKIAQRLEIENPRLSSFLEKQEFG